MNPFAWSAGPNYGQSIQAPAAPTLADPNQQFFGPADGPQNMGTLYGNYEYSDVDAVLAALDNVPPSADQQYAQQNLQPAGFPALQPVEQQEAVDDEEAEQE